MAHDAFKTTSRNYNIQQFTTKNIWKILRPLLKVETTLSTGGLKVAKHKVKTQKNKPNLQTQFIQNPIGKHEIRKAIYFQYAPRQIKIAQ